MDFTALVMELEKQTEQIKKKDLSRGEAMLVAQAHTLDKLFHKLTTAGMANMEYLSATESFF